MHILFQTGGYKLLVGGCYNYIQFETYTTWNRDINIYRIYINRYTEQYKYYEAHVNIWDSHKGCVAYAYAWKNYNFKIK